jgi:protein-S-isoprenylcysteine O-methyltransferase Ste14
VLPLAGYVWRIHVEEAALCDRLAGYTAYARRTWRLIPFVW